MADAAAPAGAHTLSVGTICGSFDTAQACATVSGQVFASYMEVYVQNAEGPGLPGDVSRITGIGVYYLGGPSMGAMGTLAAPIPDGDWTDGFSGGGGALTNPGPLGTEAWLVGASAASPGGIYGCTDPTGADADVSSCAGPLTFRFDFASTSAIRPADLEFALRSQSLGPDGQWSTKCYTSNEAGADFARASLVTTPEPATMALMATGLLGVFGVTLRRRRLEARSTASSHDRITTPLPRVVFTPSAVARGARRRRRYRAADASLSGTGGSVLSSRSARSTVPPAASAPSTMYR